MLVYYHYFSRPNRALYIARLLAWLFSATVAGVTRPASGLRSFLTLTREDGLRAAVTNVAQTNVFVSIPLAIYSNI